MNSNLQLSISSYLLWQEAQKRDIECEFFDDEHLISMKKNGKHWYTSGSRTSLQSSIGRSIAQDKNLTKKVLSSFAIPTAPFIYVEHVEHLSNLNRLRFPVVMKPVDGHQGEGVIVGIQTIEEAREMFMQQKEHVLFEELLIGIEYRVLCVDFKVFAIAYRKPAFVTGDGSRSIGELVEQKNADPKRKDGHYSPLTKIKIDSLVEKYLSEQGYTTSSVPDKSAEVFLRKTANLSTGGEAEDMTMLSCPENNKLFETIAKACDLNTIGIDVMCQSLSTPIVAQERAGIIEINASPGLRMHHFPSKGESRNVAAAILDMVERNI